MERFLASVPLRHVSHLSDALIGQAHWDDPAVEYEASIVLGEDNTATWEFVNSCQRHMARLYKHNMSIIWSVEKSSFGKNSYYYRLVENGLFKTPGFEGDYSGQAPYSDTEDEEDNGATEHEDDNGATENEAEDGENATEGKNEGETTEDTGDNDVSGNQDNVGEYSDPNNITDGIESGEESDSGSDFGDDGEE